MQFLYSWDIGGGDLDEALACSVNLKQEVVEISLYALELIRGTAEKKAELDELIVRYCANWDLKRIAVVDRNVLRMALYEMLYKDDVPPIVAIDEAVDIAKKYSTDGSGGFINGILDCIRKARLSQDGSSGEAEGHL